jgi:hypothetical protein
MRLLVPHANGPAILAGRRLPALALAGALVLAGPLGSHRPAAAPAAHDFDGQGPGSPRRGFNNASLNDRYGFHVLALTMNPASPGTGGSFPFAIAGYYEFMGDGTLSGRDVVSHGGDSRIVGREYAGTYQVNADGTGSLQLFISPTFQPEGRFVITKGGDEIEIIFAVPGNLNAFTLNKQNTR